MKRLDWIDHLPPDEGEREAAVLAYEESDEANDLYWDRVMVAGRELERRRGTTHWERSWIDDRDHYFQDDLPEPTYSPGAPA